MKQTKKILIFILYWILLSGVIRQYIYNNELILFVPDLLLFYLACSKYPKKSWDVGIGKLIPKLFATLLIGSTIISIVNLMPLISILWGLRMIVRYLLLFMFISRTFDITDIIKCKKIIVKIFWINLVFIVFQYFVEGKYGDFIGGTFEGNGKLFVFNLFCVFLFSADYFRKTLKFYKFILILAGQMFIAMAAEIKIMYFTIPLAVYAVYIMIKKFSFKHIVVLVIAFFGLIPAMTSVMSLMYEEDYIEKTFDKENIERETSKTYSFSAGENVGFNRNTSIALAGEVILKDPVHFVSGYGIGSANASSVFGTWIFDCYGVLTSYNYFTASYLLIEFGWFGFSIWIIILFLITKRFYDNYKTTSDAYIKYWATIGCLSALFSYLIAWYCNVPYCDAYLLYFLWAICFVAIRERLKQPELQKNSRQ